MSICPVTLQDAHKNLVQTTTQYNTLVAQFESAQKQLQEQDGDSRKLENRLQQRVDELEDMNLKWQERYENQTEEFARQTEWMREHVGNKNAVMEMLKR